MVKKGANRSKYSQKESYFNWCKKDVLDTYAIKDGSSSLGATRDARDQTSERLFHAHLRVEEQWETVLWEKTSVGARNSFKTYC